MIDDKTLNEWEKEAKNIIQVSTEEPTESWPSQECERLLELVDEIRRLKAVLRQIASTENWNPAFVSKLAREAVDKEESGD